MFAEELGGNASRRKQEEAREKRKKLKQQQDQKKKVQEQRLEQQREAAIAAATATATAEASKKTTTTTTTSTLVNVPTSPPVVLSESTNSVTPVTDVVPPVSTLTSESATTITTITTSTTTTKGSAVDNALRQRQQRQAIQNQLKAVVTIQSFYRADRSNSKLLVDQSTLLGQRLTDLVTLTTLVKKKQQQQQQQPANLAVSNKPYVPPPATATALCSQLLFLTQPFPYKSSSSSSKHRERFFKLRNKIQDAKKIQLIVHLVLLPGISSLDENTNPFLVWLQTYQGQRRMEHILRLFLTAVTMPNVDHQVLSICMQFFKAALGISTTNDHHHHQSTIVTFCKDRLFLPSPPASLIDPAILKNPKDPKPISKFGSCLDLITLLRRHLLYSTGGSDPIPKVAEQMRESCIPSHDRAQADAMFQLVVQAIQTSGDDTLQRRFVSEILTVPLLTWKTLDHSIHLLFVPMGADKKPFLIQLLETFTHHHATSIHSRDLEATLCTDTPLTVCPATPTQILLANLVQIAKFSPLLNGNQLGKLDFAAATTFLTFVATLVDVVPLATLSSRESVVEWIADGKGHHTPIVLSSIVMEQCKYLLFEAYIRKTFHCAIDEVSLKTDQVLHKKNDQDLKQEAALQEAGLSATSLAAKEARADKRRFWNTSGWAKRVTSGMSKILSSGDKNHNESNHDEKSAGGNLMDNSSLSRKLAMGKGSSTTTTTSDSTKSLMTESIRVGYSTDLLFALCRLYGTILARWGGEGVVDKVKQDDTPRRKQEIAATEQDPFVRNLLTNLVFSTSILRASWGLIQSDPKVVSSVYTIIDPAKGNAPVRSHSIRPIYGGTKQNNLHSNDGAALLLMFVLALSHVLIVTDDSEIHEMERPLPLHQLRRCIVTLKQLLYRAFCLDDASTASNRNNDTLTTFPSDYFGLTLVNATSKTMRDLYDRSSRRPLAVPKLWLIDDLLDREIGMRRKDSNYLVHLLKTPVLRHCPFLVSFKRRLLLFDKIVTADRHKRQGENSTNPFNNNPLKPGIPIRITRGRILEDGLATMNNLGPNMRDRLAVQYFDATGRRETGIDAGGLFKEFWTDLCAIAFNPNYALFRVTAENCMYPNPSSGAAHGSDHIMLFEFLGRILGKALYEGITVHPQFAHFFLSHLRGDYNYLNMLSDLSTMDFQLYNNIMFLKTYDGDAEDLCLTFTVASDDFGGNKEVALVPNGANIAVTNANKQRYINLVAKYHVVDRIKEQAEAFTRGLREVIPKRWLEIFNEPELQVLISGATDGKLDVDDLRANTRYAGGFSGIDRHVHRFWNVVASMDSKQQADLLRFVTSCERPPPLGFASLSPPFTIQRVGILRDGDKLPAASTCFNILKLPTYSSEKVMKERLLYAIQSGTGFELS